MCWMRRVLSTGPHNPYLGLRDENIRDLSALRFEPGLWREAFLTFSRDRNWIGLHAARCLIAEGTLQALAKGSYHSSATNSVVNFPDVTADVRSDRCLQSAPDLGAAAPPYPRSVTTVRVVEGDCLETAIELQLSGRRTAVLNMASAAHAGGGWRAGAGAQEENLFRRTNYAQHIDETIYPELDPMREWRYPIPSEGCIYSPNVIIFRGSEAKGYPFLEECTQVNMIAAAALNSPVILPSGPNGSYRMSEDSAQITRNKIGAILATAAYYHNDAVVLGAFGCGAFRNPPEHVAELFREEIAKWSGWFQEVVFSIIDDHNSRRMHNQNGNLEPFRAAFSDWSATEESDMQVN